MMLSISLALRCCSVFFHTSAQFANASFQSQASGSMENLIVDHLVIGSHREKNCLSGLPTRSF